MNRRTFLRGLGATTAIVAVGVPVATGLPNGGWGVSVAQQYAAAQRRKAALLRQEIDRILVLGEGGYCDARLSSAVRATFRRPSTWMDRLSEPAAA